MFIYLYFPPLAFIYLHLPSFTFIHLHLPSFTSIYVPLPSFTFIDLPSSSFIHTHLLSSTFMHGHCCIISRRLNHTSEILQSIYKAILSSIGQSSICLQRSRELSARLLRKGQKALHTIYSRQVVVDKFAK